MANKKEVEVTTEKVMTKYDLKQQKRKEAAANAKKEQTRNRWIFGAIAVVLLGWILSYPISNILAVNQTLFEVNGEKINRIEFEYNYTNVKNNYLSQYGSYLSNYGISDLANIDKERYSDQMTFGDYFDQLTAENIKKTKALEAAAKAEGFEMDVEAAYTAVYEDLKSKAAENSVSVGRYVKANYGKFATWNRLEDIVKENLYVEAYYVHVAEGMMATDEEVKAHYEANKREYDSVDYYLQIIEADVPTTAPDGSVPTDAEGNEIPYTPTEEEIATAMNAAKTEADKAKGTITETGDLKTNHKSSVVNYLLTDFLFGEDTEEGDVFIAEDQVNNRFLVVSFVKRYLDESPTADIRAIVSQSVDANLILDGWKGGAATEESFIKLGNLYDENGMKDYEYRYQNLTESDLDEQMSAWIFDENRVAGDTTAITLEDGTGYVLYFRALEAPIWKLSIQNTLLESALGEYMTELIKDAQINDPKGVLKYLTLTTEEE